MFEIVVVALFVSLAALLCSFTALSRSARLASRLFELEAFSARPAAAKPEGASAAAMPEATPAYAWQSADHEPIRKAVRATQPAALNWEVLAGGRALNVIGAIVLIVGVGLFLKYAFDQNWIGPALRVGLGTLAGLVLVGFGARRGRDARHWFADGVIGAGLGILYLSGFAAFASYHLIGFAAAYAFTSIVTIGAFALALRFDSLTMALVGWAGGFMTPFVMDVAQMNEIGMASYLLLLDYGVLAVALVHKRWFVLEPLALVATSVTASVWYAQHGGELPPLASTIALFSLWFGFAAANVAGTLTAKGARPAWAPVVAILNTVLFWSSLQGVLHGRPATLCGVELFAATCALGAYALLRRRGLATWPRAQWAIVAAGFAVSAISSEFHGEVRAELLAAGAIAWLFADYLMRRRSTTMRNAAEFAAAGLSILAVAGLMAIGTFDPMLLAPLHPAALLLEPRDRVILALFAACSAAAWLVARPGGLPRGLVVAARHAPIALAVAFTIGHARNYELAAALAGLGVLVVALGAYRTLRDFAVSGPALLGAAVLGLALIPQTWEYARIFDFVPLHSERLFGSLAIVAALVLSAIVLRRCKLLGRGFPQVLRLAGIAVAVFTTSTEIWNTFSLQIAKLHIEVQMNAVLEAISRAQNHEQLALTVAWIAWSMVLVFFGICFRARDLRLAAVSLFGLTILKAFFVDLSALAMPYRIASFIGLGLVLLAVSFIYSRLERRGFEGFGSAELVRSGTG